MFDALTPDRLLLEERIRVFIEFNHCHAPGTGRFCPVHGSYALHSRKGMRQRARDVAHRVGAALSQTTDPSRRRSLTHRQGVAKAVLDFLRATGPLGTLLGHHTAVKKGPKYPPRLSRAV